MGNPAGPASPGPRAGPAASDPPGLRPRPSRAPIRSMPRAALWRNRPPRLVRPDRHRPLR
ncbi:hypothetical protein NS355_09130 [Sphingomonas yabuuchiae]|uniref:Uncharacterized protein n=1 Tax=Sphingomonas yabuuchiae TaxID=172044 RepID=A0A147ISL7_9SPHN|nr:hypothetical protein NS355_09130 [Sphingomonas yabuuchiae]